MRDWALREFRVRVNLQPLIQLVRVPMWRVLIPIRGHPNPISHIVPLISHICSTLFSSPYPMSLFLVHNSTIIAAHKVKSSLSISPYLDHELALGIAYTECSIPRVQHTLRTAYTKCSIHHVQHTTSTAYTEDSIHLA